MSIPVVRLFHRKFGKCPNDILIYIFEVKSDLNSTKQEQFVLIIHSAHSPTLRKTLHFGKRASLQKSLGQNSKDSDFHYANPDKNREKLHSQSPSLKLSPL